MAEAAVSLISRSISFPESPATAEEESATEMYVNKPKSSDTPAIDANALPKAEEESRMVVDVKKTERFLSAFDTSALEVDVEPRPSETRALTPRAMAEAVVSHTSRSASFPGSPSQTEEESAAEMDVNKTKPSVTPAIDASASPIAKEEIRIKVAKEKPATLKDSVVRLLNNPQFRTCTIITAGGSITFGSVGGAFGLASGIVAGSAAGVVPALLTFGLSIPASAVIGGAGGLLVGTFGGGAAGGFAGYETFKYRVQINNGFALVKIKSLKTVEATTVKALAILEATTRTVSSVVGVSKSKANGAKNLARLKIEELAACYATTRRGATATAALAGTVVGGVTGGSAGTITGALVGVVPALFTFGLSIPVAAAVGLCCGTVVGGSAGAVGGGVVGYASFTHNGEIAVSAEKAWDQVAMKTGHVRMLVLETANLVKTKVPILQRR